PLAGAERQTLGQMVRHPAEIQNVEKGPRGLFERLLLSPHPRQVKRVTDKIAAAAGMSADAHIVEHRLAREQREVLEGTGDADLSDAMWRAVEQRAPFEQDIAPIGGV